MLRLFYLFRHDSDYLRSVMHRIAHSLRQFYRSLSATPASRWPPSGLALVADELFLRSQLADVEDSLSKSYRGRLVKAGATAGGVPRIYRIVCDALRPCLAGDQRLDAGSLVRLFEPERVGVGLTLAELWAIPALVKLVLIGMLIEAMELDPAAGEEQAPLILQNLHTVEAVSWPEVIEAISTVDRVLRQDPAGVYPRMDLQSRGQYRHVIERIARVNGVTEEHVARLALTLAREAALREGNPRTTHVGYYLIGPGFPHLKLRAGGLLPWRRVAAGQRGLLYMGSIAGVTALLTAVFAAVLAPLPAWYIVLVALVSSQAAIALVNLAVNLLVPPQPLVRLDFSKGIPGECRTFVVVPTLLLSRDNVERLLERLEIHYLANRDPNLLFGLLTDFPDSPQPRPADDPLLDLCARGIRTLNQRHGKGESGPFYLFHRRPQWNESQRAWMGWERKRGKLEDFNRLLLGEEDVFAAKAGDLRAIGRIRYVITLDSDTQLPRDSAAKLVGTLAHPLNRAVLDPATNTVREGYAVLQPRVSISVESAGRSRLARFYSGETGLDPYTTAVSDHYQDLCWRASFTGKGIYDLRPFHAVLNGRFPENTLLSHDLIEGEYARTSLASDVEVLEDYPATYEAYCKRKHRWVRGDWQILAWLLPRVPGPSGGRVLNPLPGLSRWKIFDNLRRSLFEIGLLLVLIAGWIIWPAKAVPITLAAASILLLPAYFRLVLAPLRFPPLRFLRGYYRECLREFKRAHAEAALTIAFLPHQALLAADAIARTLVRQFITRRKLLEWESMAQSEARPGNRVDPVILSLAASTVFATALGTLFGLQLTLAPFAVTSLWISLPLLAEFLNRAPAASRKDKPGDTEFLRDLALRTWRYFADFSTPSENWLVPDNVREEPAEVAHRASPTNIGLQLTSLLAAFDFGYLTHQELAVRLANTLDTLARLERYRGHFYNWYDTRTLAPLAPYYVSTVDSGNLAASLLTLKEGCEEVVERPLAGVRLGAGLRDHCLRVRAALPFALRTVPVALLVATLARLLESEPEDLFSWKQMLGKVSATLEELNPLLRRTCIRPDDAEPVNANAHRRELDVRYWQRLLNDRVRAAGDALACFAPWLTSPYEGRIRPLAGQPRYARLMQQLSRIPSLSCLPDTYYDIEEAVRELLDDEPAGSFRELLVRLVDEVRMARLRCRSLLDAFTRHARTALRWTLDMDFAFLLDPERNLLRVGYNAGTGQPDEAHYGLLASEARTAVFLAVAKGDAPCQAWFRLGRKIVSFRGLRTLASWSGTMFEYLMPSLFMKTFPSTLLGESLKGVARIQRTYASECGVPWGISESACNSHDGTPDYGYRAFGVPALTLQGRPLPARLVRNHLVVAPYAAALALHVEPRLAVENMRDMAARGWTGRYGYFESVDFRPAFTSTERQAVVRCFMAHHQGMILGALSNAVCGNRMQARFHANPMVKSVELLLQERVPTVPSSARHERELTRPILEAPADSRTRVVAAARRARASMLAS